MIDCTDATPHLLSLGLGTLAPPKRTRVEGHLARCPSCTQYFAGVEAALEQKRAARWSGRRRAAAAPPKPRRPWRLKKGRVALASAALLGLAVALSHGTSAETRRVEVPLEGPVQVDPQGVVEETPSFEPLEPVAFPIGDARDDSDIVIDLLTGEVSGSHGAVAFTSLLQDTNGDGYLEAVLVVDMEGYETLLLTAEYTGEPQGYSLNVGDSQTNNGHAGDGATQTNDAEFQIYGTELSVWGNDNVPASERNLATVKGVIQKGGRVELAIADGFVGWGYGAVAKQLRSPYLFALSGQPDQEGPVNHDVYLAFNRVVSGAYRSGSGLGKVTIRVLEGETR